MSRYMIIRDNLGRQGIVKAKGRNRTRMGGFNRLYATIMHLLPKGGYDAKRD